MIPIDQIYVSISNSPVNCIISVNNKLWCASENKIFILNEK